MGDEKTEAKIGGWVDDAIDEIDQVVAAGVTNGASESDLAVYATMKARPRGQRATQGAHELDPIKRLRTWCAAKLETVKIMQQASKQG